MPPTADYQVDVNPTSDVGDLTVIPDESEARNRSFLIPIGFFCLLLFILAIRLINLQISQGDLFQILAQGNRIETKRILAPRGVIVDRNGHDLVKNVPVYNLEIYPAQLPKTKEDREIIYRKVESVSGIKTSDIIGQVDAHGLHSLEPINLKTNIDRDTALDWQIKLSFLSGVSITRVPARFYETIPGLAHLLGYIGKVTQSDLKKRNDLSIDALVGKAGLEAEYDQYLQGKVGKEDVEVDSKGQIQRIVSTESAEPGDTLELYLDKDLEQVMADALAEGIKNAGRKKGVAIALDPNTGGVLGLVSLPSYDNNLFNQSDKAQERQALFSDKDNPLFNRAIGGVYPPGSTSKPVWAAAGLKEGVITASTDIQTPAEIKVGSSVFPDWKPHGHADVKKAIAESNNIFFYAVGGGYDKIKGLGVARMKQYAELFGWGNYTHIDLPGEVNGLVPGPEWKKKTKNEPWTIGNTYHMAIGQGDLLLTPIQLLSSIATIANGGTLYEPRVVKTVRDQSGASIEEPGKKVIRANITDPQTLQLVREGMRQTVTDGSARPLNDISMPIAGKTGTAQFEEKDKTHAWFVGFAPYDKPTITLLVMVEGGGESFTVAVPIAKKILSWYSEHVPVTP